MKLFLITYSTLVWNETIVVYASSASKARSIVSSELRPNVKILSCKLL